jgi:hypothetical protein
MAKMTRADVLRRVREIGRKGQHDYEAAPGDEDRLYQDVLQAIVDGANDPNSTKPEILAAAALKTKRFDFERYTA